MSAHHYVFVHSVRPPGEVIADIFVACGTALAPGSAGVDYSALVGSAAVDVNLAHEYDEDFGIPFPDYESVITVRDDDRDLERQEILATRIYHNLAAVGSYALALVFDLQHLLRANQGDERT